MRNRLKQIREEHNLNQTQLSNLSGISRVTINGIETGRIAVVKSDTLERIANALEVDIGSLLSDPRGE